MIRYNANNLIGQAMTKLGEHFGATVNTAPKFHLSSDFVKKKFKRPHVLFNSLNF